MDSQEEAQNGYKFIQIYYPNHWKLPLPFDFQRVTNLLLTHLKTLTRLFSLIYNNVGYIK